MTLKSINPATGLTIAEYEELSDRAVQDKLLQSEEAFRKWKTTSYGERASILLKTAALLKTRSASLATVISREMGKPLREAKAEVEKCAWVCTYYAENGASFLKSESIATDATSSFVRYDPLGPVLGIMPWNFPFWQVFRFAAPTLMAGNTVLLKHASNVQGCAALIEEIFSEGTLPSGTFINLPVASSGMDRIISNNLVKAVSLTGSETAGRQVASLAGSCIKKCLLELGGNNAFLVLEDADIELAAETGVKARMMNAGQSCIAAKRFIVDKKVLSRFTNLFLEKIRNLKMGDPMDPATNIGPLAGVSHAETVEKQVEESVRMGAVILAGGKRDKAWYTPTVLTNVKPGMPVFDEEVFGPVAPVIQAENREEAIALANNTRFGLGVTVFTGNTAAADELAGRFGDGAVFFNELVKSDPRLPFGGTGASGYGRELAVQGIREFVNVRTVYIR